MKKIFFLFFALFLFCTNSIAQIQVTGDLMLGDKEEKYNLLLSDVKDILHIPGYLNLINLEGVISDKSLEGKCRFNQPNCFSFKQKTYAAKILKHNNIHIANLANNHISDFGLVGIKDTKQTLINNNILPIGLVDENFKEVIINNKKYVFIGLSPHKNTQSIFDLDNVINKIQKYKNNNYIVVVSSHIGAEGVNKYNVENNNEIFLGSNRGNVYQLSRHLIDSGVDLFIGHGPHVLRPIEIYNNKLIVYSLGNFLTYGSFSLKSYLGHSSIMRIDLKENGDFNKIKFFGFKQSKEINNVYWKNAKPLIPSKEPFEFLEKITINHYNKYNKNYDLLFDKNSQTITKIIIK